METQKRTHRVLRATLIAPMVLGGLIASAPAMYQAATVKADTVLPGSHQSADKQTIDDHYLNPMATAQYIDGNPALSKEQQVTYKQNLKDLDNHNQADFSNKFAEMRARSSVATIYLGQQGLPRFDAWDVYSGTNGGRVISPNDFKTLYRDGVHGLVIKVDEGTSYVSPTAASQYNNAKDSGMTISTYHYCWFTNPASARAEANHYADQLQRLGIDKRCRVFADLEEHVTANSQTGASVRAFFDQLSQRGYPNHGLYTFISYPARNAAVAAVGAKNTWMAQYPYNPSGNNLWNTQYGAWQFSSTAMFLDRPRGLSIRGYNDVSVDYDGLLTKNLAVNNTPAPAPKPAPQPAPKPAASSSQPAHQAAPAPKPSSSSSSSTAPASKPAASSSAVIPAPSSSSTTKATTSLHIPAPVKTSAANNSAKSTTANNQAKSSSVVKPDTTIHGDSVKLTYYTKDGKTIGSTTYTFPKDGKSEHELTQQIIDSHCPQGFHCVPVTSSDPAAVQKLQNHQYLVEPGAASSSSASHSSSTSTAKNSGVSGSSAISSHSSAVSGSSAETTAAVNHSVSGQSSSTSSAVNDKDESGHPMGAAYKNALAKADALPSGVDSHDNGTPADNDNGATATSSQQTTNNTAGQTAANNKVNSAGTTTTASGTNVNNGTTGNTATNDDNGGATTTTTSTTPVSDDAYSPQKAALLAKTGAHRIVSGVLTTLGVIGIVCLTVLGMRKKQQLH